ncbi:hypothetical protein N323_08229, partial [Cathartes aura]
YKLGNPLNIHCRSDTVHCLIRESDGMRGNTISSDRFLPVTSKEAFYQRGLGIRYSQRECSIQAKRFWPMPTKAKGVQEATSRQGLLNKNCWGQNRVVTITLALSCLLSQTTSEELES